MRVEVVMPEAFMGDVIGDINARRGSRGRCGAAGLLPRSSALWSPLATMFGYATDLRSMTQGRATYSMEFARYAEVPAQVATEIVSKTRVF